MRIPFLLETINSCFENRTKTIEIIFFICIYFYFCIFFKDIWSKHCCVQQTDSKRKHPSRDF